MVRFYRKEDELLLNKLLSTFNINVDKLNDPYCKCIVYAGVKGALCFEEIYDRVEIDYIIVKSEYRNHGIGSKMLEYLIDYCRKNDILNITLEVNENNNAAVNLYKKYGFKLVSVRKNYYKEEDGLLMIRKFDDYE